MRGSEKEKTLKKQFIQDFEIKGVTFLGCPCSDIDWELLNDAYLAYEWYSSGFLPDAGTIYDQSEFFVRVTTLIKSFVKQG